MQKRKFTKEQKAILKNNPNFKDVISASVLYIELFKKEAIVELYAKGILPIDIFIQAGFDIEIIGRENPSKIIPKWRMGIGYNPNGINNNKNKTYSIKY